MFTRWRSFSDYFGVFDVAFKIVILVLAFIAFDRIMDYLVDTKAVSSENNRMLKEIIQRMEQQKK